MKARQDIEKIREEFKGMELTHRQFLDLIKDTGFHNKYYLYKKPALNDCSICRKFGIRWLKMSETCKSCKNKFGFGDDEQYVNLDTKIVIL